MCRSCSQYWGMSCISSVMTSTVVCSGATQGSVLSTNASPILCSSNASLGFWYVMLGDCFASAPRSTHIMASHREGDAPKPWSVPNCRLENLKAERPRAVWTLYFIFSGMCSNVSTVAILVPRRQRAIPPIDGTIRSKALGINGQGAGRLGKKRGFWRLLQTRCRTLP